VTQQFIYELEKIVKTEQILLDEPMSRHITFRVGGPADILVQPRTFQVAEVIALCKKEQEPYTIIGNGSNLLVSDLGIRGVVIELSKQASDVDIVGNRVSVQAGAMLSKVATSAAKAGLTGMEFASGIPGTIGGAVVMNAGAYGGEMSQIVKNVIVLDETGKEKSLSVEEMAYSYRHSIIMEHSYIVLSAELELQEGNSEEIHTHMKELAAQRIEKQPLEFPSAGSTFKRPEGYFAGKLIMDAGLKGFTIGGAQVSEKHCGFVINKDHATAADVDALMKHIQTKVRERFGVTLEPEVRKLGDFA
jgi:UDP-N-acetylmuramate dehydrogenase